MRLLLLFLLIWPLPALAAPVSPLASLTEPEQTYYTQIFDYTMDNVAGGSTYDWQSANGQGSISVSDAYVSKSGSTCRNFTETYSVYERMGSGAGAACRREGREGWCRLKMNGALTCAMEPPSNIFEEKLRDTTEFMDVLGTKSRSAKHSWDDWSPFK